MSDEPIATITAKNFSTWLLLGLPAIIFWGIGGWGAMSLLGGLSNGSVTPGEGSSAASLAARCRSPVFTKEYQAASGTLL